ncbi:MAG TPA: ABC transporter ATP-binding protein, partial [Lachnospiraceae bacterium]|nr:ABC transporter ATP-binding protein [Lachnospiraceae bacterium]
IMITHDRYFLDSVVNRIVEIDKGNLYSYSCSYLEYLKRKAEREEIAQAAERKRQSILRKEIEWIQRGARARSTKQKAHIARYEKLRDMDTPKTDQTIEITAGSSRLGNTTIELEHLFKSFNGNPLLTDFSYIFLHNDRVGIIGPNGCGKSTLFKMIAGKELPDSGTIKIGQTVKLGYFAQESEAIAPSVRVIDYIKEGGNTINTKEGSLSASAMLERFLFPPEMQYALVERLSGGERRRLSLLRILMEAPNILLLDEPTNDLDITTLTLLEDYLDSFHGIIVTISHDRYFLDRVCSRIFAFEGNGTLTQYEGGYTDYKNASSAEMKLTDSGLSSFSSPAETPEKTINRYNWKDGQEKKKKMSYKEQREFETIEDDIASLEEQIEHLDSEILLAASDFVRLNELTAKKEQCQSLLNEKMERWMYLEELNEETSRE